MLSSSLRPKAPSRCRAHRRTLCYTRLELILLTLLCLGDRGMEMRRFRLRGNNLQERGDL